MPYIPSIERLAREEGLEEGLEKGLEKGREKGREEGRQEGRQEGRKNGLLDALGVQLEQVFGTEGISLLPEIGKIEDCDRLKILLAAVVKIKTLAEFRQLLQKTSSQ